MTLHIEIINHDLDSISRRLFTSLWFAVKIAARQSPSSILALLRRKIKNHKNHKSRKNTKIGKGMCQRSLDAAGSRVDFSLDRPVSQFHLHCHKSKQHVCKNIPVCSQPKHLYVYKSSKAAWRWFDASTSLSFLCFGFQFIGRKNTQRRAPPSPSPKRNYRLVYRL